MGKAPPVQSSTVAESSAAVTPSQLPPTQIPVVDLIGLRFSLQHLRLVGYGLLAVWASEIVNLLSSPKVAEIGTRLHSISQFLDLSPILLVAIGLIAYQGGLRRRLLEQALLPPLLAFLPLLCALHFFLAPVSIANVITLVQKQQQIGTDQIDRIDQQLDRATSILRESDSIDALLQGLQRIPGLQVRVPPNASVSEARQEVRLSLERERDRLRERIETNLSASRDAFIRRAASNAALALVVGLLLWGLHHGAMREMEQAVPFLDWVLVHGEQEQQQAEPLLELLRFQRACLALGWFSLLERCLRLVLRVVRHPSAASPEPQGSAGLSAPPPLSLPPLSASTPLPSAPSPSPSTSARRTPSSATPTPSLTPPLQSPSLQPASLSPLPSPFSRLSASLRPGAPSAPPPPAGAGSTGGTRSAAAGPEQAELESAEFDPLTRQMERLRADAQRREGRQRQRDLDRYRAMRRRIEQEGNDPFAIFAAADAAFEAGDAADSHRFDPGDAAAGSASAAALAAPFSPRPLHPRQRRRLERDQQRARQALSRMAVCVEPGPRPSGSDATPEATRERQLQRQLAEELELLRHWSELPPPPPRGLAGLWDWFVRHF